MFVFQPDQNVLFFFFDDVAKTKELHRGPGWDRLAPIRSRCYSVIVSEDMGYYGLQSYNEDKSIFVQCTVAQTL